MKVKIKLQTKQKGEQLISHGVVKSHILYCNFF